MKAKLIFTESSASFIAEALGYSTNEEGFLTEQNGNTLIATDGAPIKLGEVAVFSKKGIVRNSLNDLINFVESENENV